jgi:ferric-dicitrate binding protein FerR (iron transport regulator)
MAAAEQASERRDQVRDALGRDLEAARYAADRAFRQYDAADPANRLVASELEARWNQALIRVAEVESKISAHEATSPARAFDPTAFALFGANLGDSLVSSDHRRSTKEAHRTHPDSRGGGGYR